MEGLARYLFLVTVFSILLAGCREKVKPGVAETKMQTVADVTVTELHPSLVDEYYETSGTVKAKTISVIASRMMGTVTSLRVKDGDRVNAGQLIMTIDDRDVAQRVKAAEKAVEAAGLNRYLTDITYQRYKRLHDERAISQQEIDQIETQKKVADTEYERAKAGLTEAQVYHGFTRITSPTSGIVTEKKIDLGSMAVPGMPLMTVEDNSSFRIEANVDEGISGKIKLGMHVDVIIDSLGQQIKGRISEIVPAIDPMSRTFLIKVDIKGSNLRSGLYAKVKIPAGKREAILVPAKTIVEKGQLTGVYAVDAKGMITYRLVRVGKHHNRNVEILSGINTGDRVITEGVERAVDGGIVGEVKTK
ncbi:MAG: efflux RND transporter periplasmic adaptor subunit [Thermodesulfovibrionales bacterium]